MLERLEPRRLLAGLTLLIHGNASDTTGWVSTASEAISDRITGRALIQRWVIARDNGTLKVTDVIDERGLPPTRSRSCEIVAEVDWSAVADGSVSTGEVGQAVSDHILGGQVDGVALASLPLQFIGHSRGASMSVAIAQDLGRRGLWIDRLTHLDPHPVDGIDDYANADAGDTPMSTPDNVLTAECFWRTDGNSQNLDFDGEPVDGAVNLELSESVQSQFIISAHAAVPAWYIGTIDLGAAGGGEHPIFDGWYGTTQRKPARDASGFAFSRLGGALTRQAAGSVDFLGGNATREPTDRSSAQWPNVSEPDTDQHVFPGGRTFPVTAKVRDRDGRATVQFFLDRDHNPINGNNVAVSDGVAIRGGGLQTARSSIDTLDVPRDVYYLGVSIRDPDGQVRYAYAFDRIDVQPPLTYAEVRDGRVIVNGDVAGAGMEIGIGGTRSALIVTRNEYQLRLDASSADRIEVDLGVGDDVLGAARSPLPIYAFGGSGNDEIRGSRFADTLSGGSGKNTIYGGDGDDRLNGSGGRDYLLGEAGDDRLYGNGGSDTLDGGGGVDRLFAGTGDDLLYGGGSNDKLYADAGNDTLFGQAGADLLDGGDGTDTAARDELDSRVAIEVLS